MQMIELPTAIQNKRQWIAVHAIIAIKDTYNESGQCHVVCVGGTQFTVTMSAIDVMRLMSTNASAESRNVVPA